MGDINQQITDVLTGKDDFKNANSGVQMSCALHFYDAACQILKTPKERRRALIDKLPAKVIPHIENEVKRVHKMRG